jgi:hypothetical protein
MIICRITFRKYQGEQNNVAEQGRTCGTEQADVDWRIMEYDGEYWNELSEDETLSRNLYTWYRIFRFHRMNYVMSVLTELLLLSQFQVTYI